MFKRLSLLLIVILGCIASLPAQDTITNRQARTKGKADMRYDEYSFRPAIDIYKKVLDKGYVSADLLRRLANSYYFNAQYGEAATIFQRMEESFPDEMVVEDIFKYAQ